MSKQQRVIEMEQHDGIFVPSRAHSLRQQPDSGIRKGTARVARPQSQPQQIGKILEGMVIDLFRSIRREMFR